MSIREQLRPLIEQAGLRKVAAETGIHVSVLSNWLSGTIPSGSQRPRRISTEQAEQLAAYFRLEIVLKKRRKKS